MDDCLNNIQPLYVKLDYVAEEVAMNIIQVIDVKAEK